MRRREPERPAADRVKPPIWVHNTGAGLRHVSGRSLMDSITTLNLSRDRALLDAARGRWCAENSCCRQGQTCREAHGVVPERCRDAGGPADERKGSAMARTVKVAPDGAGGAT